MKLIRWYISNYKKLDKFGKVSHKMLWLAVAFNLLSGILNIGITIKKVLE